MRAVLVLGAVAIHFWTAWIAWTAKGLFAALFSLTVPFLAELVWAGWLSWQARTPWQPYVQVLIGYGFVALLYGVWQRRQRARTAAGAGGTPANPDNREG